MRFKHVEGLFEPLPPQVERMVVCHAQDVESGVFEMYSRLRGVRVDPAFPARVAALGEDSLQVPEEQIFLPECRAVSGQTVFCRSWSRAARPRQPAAAPTLTPPPVATRSGRGTTFWFGAFSNISPASLIPGRSWYLAGFRCRVPLPHMVTRNTGLRPSTVAAGFRDWVSDYI